MTVDEILRRVVRAHLGLILCCALIPVAATLVLTVGQPTTWQASARMQVSANAPTSSTEAEAMSSRVLALATTPQLLREALHTVGVKRDVTTLAEHHVTAQRLGESSIVEITVTDRSRSTAARIVGSLVRKVAAFMNDSNKKQVRTAIDRLDHQIASTQTQRDEIVNTIRTVNADKISEGYHADLQAVEQQLSDLRAQRSQLTLADATSDQAIVVDGATPEVTRTASSVPPRAALALLLGLLVGLALAAATETLRPRATDARALAGLLDVPVLGNPSDFPHAVANVIALAARRQGVDTVVLIPADNRDTALLRSVLDRLPTSVTPAANRATRAHPADSGPGETRAIVLQSDQRGVALFGAVRFTDLPGLQVSEELAAGVVVISAGRVLLRRLQHLEDLNRAGRWPVLGVLDATDDQWRGGPR